METETTQSIDNLGYVPDNFPFRMCLLNAYCCFGVAFRPKLSKLILQHEDIIFFFVTVVCQCSRGTGTTVYYSKCLSLDIVVVWQPRRCLRPIPIHLITLLVLRLRFKSLQSILISCPLIHVKRHKRTICLFICTVSGLLTR